VNQNEHKKEFLKMMKITFDPKKDVLNFEKHGCSLAEAEKFEWETAITWHDDRHDYNEQRMIGLGYIGDRIFCVVFVDRNNSRRIISLRKANNKEVNRYAST
jgi:uncharacterized DUF497 family protein